MDLNQAKSSSPASKANGFLEDMRTSSFVAQCFASLLDWAECRRGQAKNCGRPVNFSGSTLQDREENGFGNRKDEAIVRVRTGTKISMRCMR